MKIEQSKLIQNEEKVVDNDIDTIEELTYIGEISLGPSYEEIGNACNEILKSNDY